MVRHSGIPGAFRDAIVHAKLQDGVFTSLFPHWRSSLFSECYELWRPGGSHGG